MGGSGGGGFFSSSPDELSKQVRDAEASQEDATYATQVSDFLASELAQYNERDAGVHVAILEKIESDLASEIESNVNLLYGGSVAKHTYVDGLSDVDALVVLKNDDAQGWTPEKLKQVFAEKLIARFGRENVSVGTMAVTVTSQGHEIQLLPAVHHGEHIKVANSSGAGWSKINPKAFSSELTRLNSETGGKLVPTIKLAKAIISTFPEQRKLSGYHVESLAMAIFNNYGGAKNTKSMLQHFFENSQHYVRTPIRDVTGQSQFVDEYLGATNSIERRVVSDSLDRIARKMKNADGAKSVSRWRELFENVGGENG